MSTKTVSFESSLYEARLITKIAQRAVTVAEKAGIPYDMLNADMDITATHLNGCPLDLAKLLAAPDADFNHDVFGIRNTLNRKTGKLGNCFDPRCSLPAVIAT